jgi:hypothetical protein
MAALIFDVVVAWLCSRTSITFLLPNVLKNQPCHEKGRTPRVNVIIGTEHLPDWIDQRPVCTTRQPECSGEKHIVHCYK